MKIFLFFLLLSIFAKAQIQPCDADFQMLFEENRLICDDENFTLTPNVLGLDSFVWSDGSFDNPKVVDSSGQYIINGFIYTDELIVNGNFDNGNNGFSSQYLYNATSIWNEGTYVVTPDVSIQHPLLSSLGNGGNGNFLAVNGTGAINTEIWCQTINVLPNTDYDFSAWVTSTSSGSPAILQFSVNGTLLSTPFTASPTLNSWNEFTAVWNSGINTSVEICVVNQNTSLGGNDFGLDDISFVRQCPNNVITDTFNLVVKPYADATIIESNPVCVSDVSTNIQTIQSGGYFTGSGFDSITNVFNPSVAGVGVHNFSYEIEDPCGDEQFSSIEVMEDIELGTDTSVCEIDDDFVINILAGSGGSWQTTLVSDDGLFSPSQNGPGIYNISYANEACSDDLEVRVFEYPEIEIPILEACPGVEPAVFYFDSIYDDYIWSDGTNTSIKQIDVPGNYSLTIKNGTCERTYSFKILNSCRPDIFFPNTMTPNGDNLNDTFFPVINGVDENYMFLKVFDRWGKLMYSSRTSETPWLGNNLNNEKVKQGMYVYTFEYGYSVLGVYSTEVINGVINVIY